VDGYLLAMASLYLKRAGLNTCGYTKDRYLFYALYLAIGTFCWHYSVFALHGLAPLFLAETEEDLPRGAEEILLYLLGPLPSSAKGEGPSLLRSTQQLEWDTRLSRFLAGKDKVQLLTLPSSSGSMLIIRDLVVLGSAGVPDLGVRRQV
jgi:hypothetical protein